MSVYVDTGVLFGATNPNDSLHDSAKRILGEVTQAVCSDHVIAETWTLLNARLGRAYAMRFWDSLDRAPLTIECALPTDLERARAIVVSWPDQTFSFVDCTSFAVMERLGIRKVASFDNDFLIYRIGMERKSSFEVLR